MARNYADKAPAQYDFNQLQSKLVNSKLQKINPSHYDIVRRLIEAAGDFQSGIDNSRSKSIPIDLTDVTGVLDPNNGGVASGSYVPILTPTANVNTHSEFYTSILITGALIQISGKLNIKPSVAATLTTFDLKLPIHSNFVTPDQLQGVINGIPLDGSTEGFAGIIMGNVTNGQASMSFYPRNNDNHDCRFILTYQLL